MSALAEYQTHLQRRGLMPSSINRRIACLRYLANSVPDLFAVTPADIERLLERPIGPRTRYWWLSHLSCFYRWAINQGMTDSDPTARILRPRLRRALPRPISDDDLQVALLYSDRTIGAWLRLAAFAGLRCAEIASLEAGDVLTSHDQLRVVGKGDKERIVPLHPEVLAGLDRYGLRHAGPVFRDDNGQRYTPKAVSFYGNRYMHRLGIDATMHQLRHWFATNALLACRDLRVVQELLGHESCLTTAAYAAFSNARAREAVLAIGGNHAAGNGVEPRRDADQRPLFPVRE